MLDLLHASETVSGHTIRAWTGVATDEGVGLIALVEVSDDRGVPVCRFEDFLSEVDWRGNPDWPSGRDAAAAALQERAIGRARLAVLAGSLHDLHGHRFDVK